MIFNIVSLDTVDSTNVEALRLAKAGAAQGLCIISHEQTEGRGRYGRTWSSTRGSGIYFSIVLRPAITSKFLPLITLMAGVAVHQTLEDIGIHADIKWVNDLLVNEKKVAGILAEATDTTGGLAVVVGIGINLTSDNFPLEIADSAASIADILQTTDPDKDGIRQVLLGSLTHNLDHFYAVLLSDTGVNKILAEWRDRSTYYAGKVVRVVLENETVYGTTDGLEADGALRLLLANGSIRVIQAGDVQRLRTTKG